jgi:predicted ArsR family transcriptional regulator
MNSNLGRPPNAFEVVDVDLIEIRGVLADGKVEFRTAKRARILLLRSEGMWPREVAERVGVNASTVFRACERYEQGGLVTALMDAPRSGRPRRFSP